MHIQATFLIISTCNVTLTRQSFKNQCFWSFSSFPSFYASFPFSKCSIKDKVQKKQTLQNPKPLQQFQKRRKINKQQALYTRTDPFNQIQLTG